MCAKGVAKLSEEVGELQIELGRLQQTLAKKLAYFHTDEHPDGAGPLSERLENEMGDVCGAIAFVVDRLGLNAERIDQRMAAKKALFMRWDAEPDNNKDGVDRVVWTAPPGFRAPPAIGTLEHDQEQERERRRTTPAAPLKQQ